MSRADDDGLSHAKMTPVPFADSIKKGLLATGWYASQLGRDAFPGVLGLCYHGIRESPEDDGRTPFANLHVIAKTFDAQCRMIADTCHPIDLATFCAARASGGALPDRPVLLTFDDGYRSVFELARPILLRYKIPATVFVCSEPVRRQRLFWFDAVTRALGPAALADVRALPNEGWRRAAEEHDAPASAAPHLAPMTEAQVRQLADEGFAIGVHTASHAPLATTPPDGQRHELESCREALESWTGHRVHALAYPFGAPRADYTEETVAIAGSLRFTAGFTTRNDFARPTEPALERSRFVMLAAVTAADLAHRIAYAWPR
jgi:peptidoglycan/xylan/chitin deacetylase (PgdA/CDA1 family)